MMEQGGPDLPQSPEHGWGASGKSVIKIQKLVKPSAKAGRKFAFEFAAIVMLFVKLFIRIILGLICKRQE